MFDIHKDSAPSNMTKLFMRTSNNYIYNTRSSTSQFFSVKSSRLKMQKKKAFSRVGVKVWNEMPNEYKNLSKKSFKKETKRALLNILETEDSYMEPDEIMLKFKHNKIESNETSSTIFFVHLETLGLFLLYNNICHFPFFLFLFFFAYLFVLLCYISSFPFYFQCH